MIHFGKKDKVTLGASIFGTKCDSDKTYFSAEIRNEP